jgi:hypothetical protein
MKKIVFFLVIIIATLTACDSNVEINVSDIVIDEVSNFQVDFDGQTWVAETVVTVIDNGITSIIAVRNNGEEVITISLLRVGVGSYTISAAEFVGGIAYVAATGEDAFVSDPNSVLGSGRIDITEFNTVAQLMSGQFFFTGKRFIQQFDANGDPILDALGLPVFTEEIKTFTNGIFDNLSYTTEIPGGSTNDNEFFVKIDGVEFVEEMLTATKVTQAGVSTISISASRNSGTESVALNMPADIVTGNYIIVGNGAVIGDVVGLYDSDLTTFNAAVASTTPLPILRITRHDTANKILEGTFEFFAQPAIGGTQYHLTEGDFKVTYTE